MDDSSNQLIAEDELTAEEWENQLIEDEGGQLINCTFNNTWMLINMTWSNASWENFTVCPEDGEMIC